MGRVFFRTKLKFFCEKNHANLILLMIGDHRSNGVVRFLIYTVKVNLMAISINVPKLTLKAAIDEIQQFIQRSNHPLDAHPF